MDCISSFVSSSRMGLRRRVNGLRGVLTVFIIGVGFLDEGALDQGQDATLLQ